MSIKRLSAFTLLVLSLETAASVTEAHGIKLFGDLKYNREATSSSCVDSNAKQGGTLRLSATGSFDTLSPYTLKGISPYQSPGMGLIGIGEWNESLLIGAGEFGQSCDEVKAGYGLLAKSLKYDESHEWVEFTLDNAHFHDGHPVTSDDVIFSYKALRQFGHPRFKLMLGNVATVEALSDRKVKITFTAANDGEDILKFGSIPILPEHAYTKNLKPSTEFPLLSGPYVIDHVEMGKRIVFKKHGSFWAKKHWQYHGKYNFDRVVIDFYRDPSVAFESFAKGDSDFYYEWISKQWANNYDFARINSGEVVREEILHSAPAGAQGFYFNTRLGLFNTRDVRKAISMMFDFAWANKNLFHNAYTRNRGLFPNSPYEFSYPISDSEKDVWKDIQSNHLPVLIDETNKNPDKQSAKVSRSTMRNAISLLKVQGWKLENNVMMKNGQPFEFEVVYFQRAMERVILPFAKKLERIGVKLKTRLLDISQFKRQVDSHEFDMVVMNMQYDDIPGYELFDLYHGSSRDVIGSKNLSGLDEDISNYLVERIVKEPVLANRTALTQALDRFLVYQHISIPQWHINKHRVAYNKKLIRPKIVNGRTLNFESWWIDE